MIDRLNEQAQRSGEHGVPLETHLWSKDYRPLNAVDQLAIQTSYASVAFIAAHLRAYAGHQMDYPNEPYRLPKTVLDAAERTAKVLDQMRHGDQEQWGHIVETMTRAANLLDGSTSEPPAERAGVVTDLREAVEWMQSGGASDD